MRQQEAYHRVKTQKLVGVTETLGPENGSLRQSYLDVKDKGSSHWHPR